MSSSNFSSFDQIGKKEDISDIITDISPTDTPVTSTAMKGSVNNSVFGWQQDELAAANAENAMVETADAADANITPTTMLENRTQIFEKTVKVTGRAQAISTYGRDELPYQIEKKGKELKRDMEAAAVGADRASVIGSDSTASKTASLINFVDAGNTVDAGGSVSEDSLMECLEACYENGAEPSLLLTRPKHSLAIAGWATAAGRQRDFGSTTALVNTIDILVTPFGTLEVVQDRFMSDDHIIAYDPNMFSVEVLRPTTIQKLAKTGDQDKYQILNECGFKVHNTKAHGFIYNLSV